MTSLQTELEHNLATVEPYVEFHRRFVEALDKVDAASSNQSGFQRVAAIRQTQAALGEVAWAEQSLVSLYRKQLPALKEANRD